MDSIIDEQNEWNAAILDATAERIENYYAFNVDVARYGESGNMEVRVEVQNANAMDSSDVGATIVFSEVVFCENAQPIRVIFTNEDRVKENEANVVYVPIAMQDRIYAYQSIHISLNENDSFSEDNSFNIYNGQKEVVKVQYYSAGPNPFFTSGLSLLRSNFADRWDVQVTEVKKGGEFALEGFDFYVFEHSMPEKMPEDGVVFLVNPDFRFGTAPAGSGIQLKDEIMTFSNGASLEANVDTHPIVNYLPLNTIQITALSLLSYDTDYEVLATCANEPALLVKNQAKEKVVVMPFSVHYSDVAINIGLPTLIYNVFSYFFPSTLVSGSNAAAVEVYESVELTGRGTELYISRGAETLYTYTEFPAVLRLDKPGTYSITQTTIFEKNVTESIYVKIPSQESDIFKEDEALRNPYATQEDVDYYEDLLLYFAIALVALLFCEWWLQSREQV